MSTIATVGLPLGIHSPNNLSHLERVACRPINLLLQSTSKSIPKKVMEMENIFKADNGSNSHSIQELRGLQQPTVMTQHGSDSYRVHACLDVNDGDDGG